MISDFSKFTWKSTLLYFGGNMRARCAAVWGDLSERQNAARAARRTAYGDLGDQLDMQYHDSVDGTSTWKDHVAKVKSDNPIPTE